MEFTAQTFGKMLLNKLLWHSPVLNFIKNRTKKGGKCSTEFYKKIQREMWKTVQYFSHILK